MLSLGYKHHVFISYRHAGAVPDWLHNHLAPVLTAHLENLLPEEPSLFIDKTIEVGEQWPEQLATALQKSGCLLAIWNPPYFRSRWCMAEWESMRRREELLRSSGCEATLVYPIIFGDGKHFPEAVKATQSRLDLKRFAYPYRQFRDTPLYLEFDDMVRSIAEDLALRLSDIPPWRKDWPIVTPDPERQSPAAFPRI